MRRTFDRVELHTNTMINFDVIMIDPKYQRLVVANERIDILPKVQVEVVDENNEKVNTEEEKKTRSIILEEFSKYIPDNMTFDEFLRNIDNYWEKKAQIYNVQMTLINWKMVLPKYSPKIKQIGDDLSTNLGRIGVLDQIFDLMKKKFPKHWKHFQTT